MSVPSMVTVFDSKVHDSFPRYLARNLSQLHVFRFAIYNFVVNNIRKRYRRSTLGFLWSLLNPLLVMSVIAVVFSLIFQRELRTFAVYIFSGLAPWSFINLSIQAGSMSLIHSEGFLKKVYVPKVVFPIVTVTTETVNFAFSLVSLYILAVIIGFPVNWRVVLLPFAIIITYIFILGLVLIFGTATVYFRDLSQILSVIFSALFYTIPVVYPITSIPDQYHILFTLNPFFHFVMLFRRLIYDPAPMIWTEWAYPAILAVITLVLGLYVLMKRDRDIVYRL